MRDLETIIAVNGGADQEIPAYPNTRLYPPVRNQLDPVDYPPAKKSFAEGASSRWPRKQTDAELHVQTIDLVINLFGVLDLIAQATTAKLKEGKTEADRLEGIRTISEMAQRAVLKHAASQMGEKYTPRSNGARPVVNAEGDAVSI